ncbi:MAG: OadG family protein [Muribaculaceae bacterium]|nr:OadG family protein [Muribaculaceae bacterium]
MKKKGILLILLVAVMSLFASAQGRMELRFNEAMVQNDSNLVDHTGHRSAWIEIFNRSYGTVGMEQMFISNQKIDIPANGQKPKDFLNDYAKEHPEVLYEIPRGDVATKVAPRTHIVFFADGESSQGALHLSFKLTPGEENNLYLYDVNGDLVDAVTIPANLPANNTFALKSDGASNLIDGVMDASAWSVRDGQDDATAITPGKYNQRVINENIEKFHEKDPHGYIISVIAMLIVFSALLMLSILFWLFGKANKAANKEVAVQQQVEKAVEPVQAVAGNNDEAIAAICMALYQHFNAHDEESGILTFNRDANTAWSSKSGMMRSLPQKQ